MLLTRLALSSPAKMPNFTFIRSSLGIALPCCSTLRASRLLSSLVRFNTHSHTLSLSLSSDRSQVSLENPLSLFNDIEATMKEHMTTDDAKFHLNTLLHIRHTLRCSDIAALDAAAAAGIPSL